MRYPGPHPSIHPSIQRRSLRASVVKCGRRKEKSGYGRVSAGTWCPSLSWDQPLEPRGGSEGPARGSPASAPAPGLTPPQYLAPVPATAPPEGRPPAPAPSQPASQPASFLACLLLNLESPSSLATHAHYPDCLLTSPCCSWLSRAQRVPYSCFYQVSRPLFVEPSVLLACILEMREASPVPSVEPPKRQR